MAKREKVIYSIERCICHVPDACRDCAYDAGHPYNECVEMLLRDALEMLKVQEPGWISVKDKMPGNNKDIIIYGEWTGQSGTKYREIILSGMDDFIYQGNTPIAWIPIPEPPKEEETC